jgi:DNA-binding MarR family transcriptional regulator
VEPDEIIHQPVRLKIMSVLNTLPAGEAIEFARMKAIAKVTDGNLGAHLGTLEKAGYVAIKKDFVGKRPRTRVALTAAGRRAFGRHIQYLREIVDGASDARSD